MNFLHRFVLSLLISTVLFLGFSIFAFTDLFELIQTQYFSPRTQNAFEERLIHGLSSIEKYQKQKIEIFNLFLKNQFILLSFNPTISRDAILERVQKTRGLIESFRGEAYFRILDKSLQKVNFSTLDRDVFQSNSTSIVYKNLNQDEYDLYQKVVANTSGRYYDENTKSFIYGFPLLDNLDIQYGWAFFSVSDQDLKSYLINQSLVLTFKDIWFVNEKTVLLSVNGY